MASSRKAAPDLAAALAACLARWVRPQAQVVVGYSGGLDSTVLLHVLAGLVRGGSPYRCAALHVHHGLLPQADAWVQHCQDRCAALAMPLQVERVQVRRQGQGVEAAARAARYQAFQRSGAAAILLAQHQDDQVETVLLQMQRGATARGLAAMPEARWLTPDQVLLRPFLGVSRHELEGYAWAHGLTWVEDASNQDHALARNRLRHGVLPRVERLNPGFSAGMLRLAAQCAEWADLLDALAQQDLPGVARGDGLDLAGLLQMPDARLRNLLRWWLERSGGKVGHAVLVEAVRQLRGARADTRLRVAFGPVSLGHSQGRIEVVPNQVFQPPPCFDLAWQGAPVLDMGPAGRLHVRPEPGGITLPDGPVRVRSRRGGDRVCFPRPHGRPGEAGYFHRPLKDLLRERGIPPWRRPWLPLVEAGGRILWVADLGGVDCARAPTDREGWSISWEPPW